jgi:NDP-sugar pyrophosphorylase family protein
MFEHVEENSNTYWAAIFQNLVRKTHGINYIVINSPWIEVDTKEDLEIARNLLKSRSTVLA